ncbi:MAG: hypothetical protein CL933_12490 [Deltaproteobacteria bacterium]|nr:hypothetical protein [Deltaproteobacteria bacterium]
MSYATRIDGPLASRRLGGRARPSARDFVPVRGPRLSQGLAICSTGSQAAFEVVVASAVMNRIFAATGGSGRSS